MKIVLNLRSEEYIMRVIAYALCFCLEVVRLK